MKNLTFACVLFAAVSLLGGCAQHQDSAPASSAGLLCNVCVMTGEALDDASPTSSFGSGKVGFCCEKCQAKWDKLDDAGKQAAVAAQTKK